MVETLVQWTLLNNPDKLGHILNFEIAKIIGQEITTQFGRIDFILEDTNKKQLIVELETELNNQYKLNYCFKQTIGYKNVKFVSDTEYCILYANETNEKNKKLISRFGQANGIITRTYSIQAIQMIYSETIGRLSLSMGLALPNPKNYTICYLRWLNKIMKPFLDLEKTTLLSAELFSPFVNPNNSKTNFNCYERVALDFELIVFDNNKYHLTDNGEVFIKNINPFVHTTNNVSSVNLTNEQKRLLLKVLTNGNWHNKIHKVNIYWFLRFIEVTNGSWLPKSSVFEQSKLDIARSLFNVSYNVRTMYEFLSWCCNYCIELGLVEKVKSTSNYDQVILTPIGVEVTNIFSLDLALKKSRLNLNFKFLG